MFQAQQLLVYNKYISVILICCTPEGCHHLLLNQNSFRNRGLFDVIGCMIYMPQRSGYRTCFTCSQTALFPTSHDLKDVLCFFLHVIGFGLSEPHTSRTALYINLCVYRISSNRHHPQIVAAASIRGTRTSV